jgi:hypothetical protein
MKNLYHISFGQFVGPLVSAFFFTGVAGTNAQTTDNNYVKTYHAQVALTGDVSTVNDKSKVVEGVTYYDGHGRPIQTVAKQSSPNGSDIVTTSTYDAYGKNTVNYLPFPSTESVGSYKINAISDQRDFYSNMFPSDGNFAITTQVLEHSELGRTTEQSAPGSSWAIGSGRTIKKDYLTNDDDDVLLFTIDSNGDLSSSVSYRDANSLVCTKTTDEEHNDMFEYTDKEGRSVCKKVKAPGGLYASTYYVYDNIGNLAFVLPPEAVRKLAPNN